jgi:hypothetical protein
MMIGGLAIKLGASVVGAEIKSRIVRIEIRELECDNGVSHHTIKTILRDEAGCRKTVTELA